MRALAIASIIAFPAIAWAVGIEDNTPPKPTKTTTECQDGMVWDEGANACVAPKESSLSDDALYGAAREFAYAGQFENALSALRAMSDQGEDRVLTYTGFALRKSGETERGLAYYERALAQNPDNLLARSYLGQAYVALGETELAHAELQEIRARGGRMTWPEIALQLALRSGASDGY